MFKQKIANRFLVCCVAAILFSACESQNLKSKTLTPVTNGAAQFGDARADELLLGWANGMPLRIRSHLERMYTLTSDLIGTTRKRLEVHQQNSGGRHRIRAG